MDLFEALENRRSIRKYTPEPVTEEKILKVLEAARMAPSWANKQCWSFIVVKDRAKREQLAETLPKGNPATKALRQAPVAIVLCADPAASGKIDGKEYYLLDSGLAMQQLVLAAYAEGLGTCWIAWFDETSVRALLKVPEKLKIIALSPLGTPAKEGTVTPRKDLSEITFYEEWGRS